MKTKSGHVSRAILFASGQARTQQKVPFNANETRKPICCCYCLLPGCLFTTPETIRSPFYGYRSVPGPLFSVCEKTNKGQFGQFTFVVAVFSVALMECLQWNFKCNYDKFIEIYLQQGR